jgi:hypothetical protein
MWSSRSTVTFQHYMMVLTQAPLLEEEDREELNR